MAKQYDSFIFFESFHKAISRCDDETQLEAYRAITTYALYGEEVVLKTSGAAMIMDIVKPLIDANNKKRAGGRKGGAPKGNSNAKKQPKQPMVDFEKQPMVVSENNQKQPNNNSNRNNNHNGNDKEIYTVQSALTVTDITEARAAKKAEEQEQDVRFETFWSLYPKKVAKVAAKKAWAKVKPSPELYTLIMDKLDSFTRSEDWIKEGGRYVPNPATWLNGKRWLDEITVCYPRVVPSPNARGQPINAFDVLGEIIAEEEAKEREQERNRAINNADILGLPEERTIQGRDSDTDDG